MDRETMVRERETSDAILAVESPSKMEKRKKSAKVYAVRHTIADIQEALQMTNGNLTEAAKLLETTRPVLQRKVDNYPSLKKFLENLLDQNLDYTEDKLLQLVNEGNITAVTFYLRTKGKGRGYTEKNTTELELGENARSSAALIESMRKGAKEAEVPKTIEVKDYTWEE